MTGRRYSLNESAFDTLAEESEYWLGFMMADGNVCMGGPGKKYKYVQLDSVDHEHIDKLAKFLNFGAKIILVTPKDTRRPYKHLAFSSEKVGNKLESYGITQRKSLTCKAAPELATSRHFWRGVVDGDGNLANKWVKPKNRPNSYHKPSVQVVGSVHLMTQFCDFVEQTLGFRPGMTKDQNIYHVTIGNRNAIRTMELLYGGAETYLDRKYAIYVGAKLDYAKYLESLGHPPETVNNLSNKPIWRIAKPKPMVGEVC